MSTPFVATCDRCGEPIRRWSQLVVWCDDGKAREVRKAWEAHERERHQRAEQAQRAGDREGFLRALMVTPAEAVELPHPVPWHILHLDCIRDEEWEWGYPIEGKRINTVSKALAWTLHLQEKVWFEYTDWRGVMQRLFRLPDP